MTATIEDETPIGPWARVTATFVNPPRAFRDIAKRPGAAIPLLICTLFSLAYTLAMAHFVGWERLSEFRISHSAYYASLSAGQQEAVLQQQVPLTRLMGYCYSSLGTALEVALAAGVLFVVFSDGRLRFKQAFAIVAYSFLPGSIAAAAGALVVAIKDPDTVNPDRILLMSLDVVPHATAPAWLSMILESVDVFSVWTVLLVAVGFRVASRNSNFGVVLLKVCATWFVWIGLRAALA